MSHGLEPCPTGVPGLCFRLTPEDADVTVNEKAYGQVAKTTRDAFIPLSPGIYRITLTSAGYATWRGEVSVGSEGKLIEVVLKPGG